MFKAYPAVFHAENNGFWVEFPDLSGCFSEGDSIEEAASEASSALGAYLRELEDRNITVPEPSDINSLVVENDNDFVLIVSPTPPHISSSK